MYRHVDASGRVQLTETSAVAEDSVRRTSPASAVTSADPIPANVGANESAAAGSSKGTLRRSRAV